VFLFPGQRDVHRTGTAAGPNLATFKEYSDGEVAVSSALSDDITGKHSMRTRVEDIAGRGPALELVRGTREVLYLGEQCISVANVPSSTTSDSQGKVNPHSVSTNLRLVPGVWAYRSTGSGLVLPECNFEVQTTDFGKEFSPGHALGGYAVALDVSLSLSDAGANRGNRHICILSGGTDGGHDTALTSFAKVAAKLSPYELYAPAGARLDPADEDSLFYLYEPRSSSRHLVRIERGPKPQSSTMNQGPVAIGSSSVSPDPQSASILGAPIRVVDVESGTLLWDYGRSWFLVQYGHANILLLPDMADLPATLRREVHRRCIKAGGFVHPSLRTADQYPLSGTNFPALRSGTTRSMEHDEEAHFADPVALEAARISLLELGLKSAPKSSRARHAITVMIECETNDPELLMDISSEMQPMRDMNGGIMDVPKKVHWTASFSLPFEENDSMLEGGQWCSLVVSVEPPPTGSSNASGSGGGGVLVSRLHLDRDLR
jgi:hypothetical protein